MDEKVESLNQYANGFADAIINVPIIQKKYHSEYLRGHHDGHQVWIESMYLAMFRLGIAESAVVQSSARVKKVRK